MAKKKNNEYLKQNRQINPACNYNGICPAAHQNTMKEQLDILNRKYTLGYLLVISVVIAVVSRFIPFHKTIRVTFKRTGDDMV